MILLCVNPLHYISPASAEFRLLNIVLRLTSLGALQEKL
jgi:hypothetical protein